MIIRITKRVLSHFYRFNDDVSNHQTGEFFSCYRAPGRVVGVSQCCHGNREYRQTVLEGSGGLPEGEPGSGGVTPGSGGVTPGIGGVTPGRDTTHWSCGCHMIRSVNPIGG